MLWAGPLGTQVFEMNQGDEAEDHTGLSQSVGQIAMGAEDHTGLSQSVGQLAMVADVPTSSSVNLSAALLQQFVEGEMMQHFPLVRAAGHGPGADIQYPTGWNGLQDILHKLAFSANDTDIWRCLGMAMFEGPEPTESKIRSRARLGSLLCSLGTQASWSQDCQRKAAEASRIFQNAADSCCNDLGSALAERKRHKVGTMALHKELGAQALALLRRDALGGTEDILTQWSNVAALPGVHSAEIASTREIAALAEKGNGAVWDRLAGRRVVLWAPDDGGACARLLKAFQDRIQPGQLPTSVRLIAPISLFPGMASVEQVEDLWNHPLNNQKWAPFVKATTYTVTPLDMVLPGGSLPKHARMGLAVFTLGHSGSRIPTVITALHQPLLQLDEARAAILDFPATQLSYVLKFLSDAGISRQAIREPRRSPISSAEWPRLELKIIVSSSTADFSVVALLRGLRSSPEGQHIVFGLQALYGADDACILEVGSPLHYSHFWPLCTQMVFLTNRKAIVYTDASELSWIQSMDACLNIDHLACSSKLRWKSAAKGGRTLATPSHTGPTLSASKRVGGRQASTLDNATVLSFTGEVGVEDTQVLVRLLEHVVNATQLPIVAAADPSSPQLGEFAPLVGPDGAIEPGRLKVILNTRAEVVQLHEALHGQSVTVGGDSVGVVVSNDALLAHSVLGERRGRTMRKRPRPCRPIGVRRRMYSFDRKMVLAGG